MHKIMHCPLIRIKKKEEPSILHQIDLDLCTLLPGGGEVREEGAKVKVDLMQVDGLYY